MFTVISMVICLFVFIPVSAQNQTGTGKIIGKLEDSHSGKTLGRQTILLYSGDQLIASSKSNTNGNFSFFSLEQGNYIISVSRDGFASYNKTVRVNQNIITKLIIALKNAENEQQAIQKRAVSTSIVASPKKIVDVPKETKPQVSFVSNQTPVSSETKSEPEEINIVVVPAEELKLDDTEILFYDAVEEMPEPVDGWASLMKNILYPSDAHRLNIQGTIYLQAYITTDGDVTNLTVLKSIPALDLAAQEAVYKTKFKPGKIGNETVNAKITIPVPFKIKQ